MGTLANNYLLKAIDAYPYELAEASEALNYALSYDEKNTNALCLMGRIYAEQLNDFEKAKACYTQALAENINAVCIYPHYINVLLWNEDHEEAKKLIDFALTVKGSDKGVLYLKKAILSEQSMEYKKALKFLKKAKNHTYNTNYMEYLNEQEDRIKGKIPKKKKSKSGKKQKKRTKYS